MDQPATVTAANVSLAARQAEAQFALSPAGQMLKQFEFCQRVGQMYASSTIVPDTYKNNVANCAIAAELALRMQMPAMMVMQNLYVVHGNPAWSAKFLIACVNGCGRFTTLEYHETAGVPRDSDDWGVRCVAYERTDTARQRPLSGPCVTWRMVKAEGWLGKNGSKWRTMPEVMFRYRAAAMWQRTYAPDLGMGILTQEEVQEQYDQPAIDITDSVTTVTPDRADAKAAQAPSPERVAELMQYLGKCSSVQLLRGFRKTYRDDINASDQLRQAVIDRMQMLEIAEAAPDPDPSPLTPNPSSND